MKKIYITPETETVNLLCFSPVANPILETSTGGTNSDGDSGSNEGDFEAGEAADEYRGSWEGIWDNM